MARVEMGRMLGQAADEIEAGAADAAALEELRRDFPRWNVRRAVRQDGAPGWWMANRPRGSRADATLLERSAGLLRQRIEQSGPESGSRCPR